MVPSCSPLPSQHHNSGEMEMEMEMEGGNGEAIDAVEQQEEQKEGMEAEGQRQPQRKAWSSSSSSCSALQQQQQPAIRRSTGYVGKHRLSAAIARLDQEFLSLQDELNELETTEPASAACHEVITSTEGKPDPLLPVTSGPENSSWERWFQPARSSRGNKWWAPKGSEF